MKTIISIPSAMDHLLDNKNGLLPSDVLYRIFIPLGPYHIIDLIKSSSKAWNNPLIRSLVSGTGPPPDISLPLLDGIIRDDPDLVAEWRDKFQRSFAYACNSNNNLIYNRLELYFNWGCDIHATHLNPFLMACQGGNVHIAQWLLDKAAQTGNPIKVTGQALNVACCSTNLDMVVFIMDLLDEANAFPDPEKRNKVIKYPAAQLMILRGAVEFFKVSEPSSLFVQSI